MSRASIPSFMHHRTTAQRSVTLVLVLLILLPALLFSAYELSTLNATEELLTSAYNRQLDGMLSSVNQFAWDVVSTWAFSLARGVAEGGASDSLLRAAVDRHEAVEGVMLADTLGTLETLVTKRADERLRPKLERVLSGAAKDFPRMLRLRDVHYTKLEPYVLDSTAGDTRVVLLFAVSGASGRPAIAGFILDQELFVRNVLGPRLEEAATSEFVVAVLRKGEERPVFVTTETGVQGFRQRRSLWIFPDLEAGIRFQGTSVEELASSRSTRSLVLILLLDGVLLAGAWATYRNIRREVEFARLKSDFVSNVSHELRTPLALIRMYAETLEMGRIKDETKKQQYHATIVTEAARLTRLVNNILNFSRMEAGRMPYRFTRTDLNRVVREVAGVWEANLHAEGVHTVIRTDENLPAVLADCEAVTEALMNLVDNAVKYGGTGKYLGIATGTTDGQAFIRVEDHGIGVAHEHQQKIFEMFFRVPGGSLEVSGSGVGLAVVRHIMHAHHGEVRIVSTPGTGSIFTLLFPCEPRMEPQEQTHID